MICFLFSWLTSSTISGNIAQFITECSDHTIMKRDCEEGGKFFSSIFADFLFCIVGVSPGGWSEGFQNSTGWGMMLHSEIPVKPPLPAPCRRPAGEEHRDPRPGAGHHIGDRCRCLPQTVGGRRGTSARAPSSAVSTASLRGGGAGYLLPLRQRPRSGSAKELPPLPTMSQIAIF